MPSHMDTRFDDRGKPAWFATWFVVFLPKITRMEGGAKSKPQCLAVCQDSEVLLPAQIERPDLKGSALPEKEPNRFM